MRISKTAQKPWYFKQKISHRISKSKNKETRKIANLNFQKWKQKLPKSKIASFSYYLILSQKMNCIYETNSTYETNFIYETISYKGQILYMRQVLYTRQILYFRQILKMSRIFGGQWTRQKSKNKIMGNLASSTFT